MPQLDATHMMAFFLWTWLTLFLLMKKIKTTPMTKAPKYQPNKVNLHRPETRWT